MQEEIASTAGMIWHALDDRGELSLAQLEVARLAYSCAALQRVVRHLQDLRTFNHSAESETRFEGFYFARLLGSWPM